MQTFEIEPRGPFSLDAARGFAGGFAAGIGGGDASGAELVMAFPVEGWEGSVAVGVRQLPSGTVQARFDGSDDADAVRRQVARCLSLDHDGTGWPAVGERDPVIGRLQSTHDYLRPVCFYSAAVDQGSRRDRPTPLLVACETRPRSSVHAPSQRDAKRSTGSRPRRSGARASPKDPWHPV